VTISPLPLRHAVTMFGERAARVSPGFRVTAANRATVEAICGHVDRLPLGIGLAARQLAAESLEELWSRLRADRWSLRDTDDVPPRQQTLRSAIGWSHQLCTPAERLLWARLSVFTGPFRLEDAQDVCVDQFLADQFLAGQDVADGVGSLATRSILAMDVRADGQIQYSLPGTVRAYGADMLIELGEEAGGWRRYRAWLEARPAGGGTD
jgi:predicted ATPase